LGGTALRHSLTATPVAQPVAQLFGNAGGTACGTACGTARRITDWATNASVSQI